MRIEWKRIAVFGLCAVVFAATMAQAGNSSKKKTETIEGEATVTLEMDEKGKKILGASIAVGGGSYPLIMDGKGKALAKAVQKKPDADWTVTGIVVQKPGKREKGQTGPTPKIEVFQVKKYKEVKKEEEKKEDSKPEGESESSEK